MHVSCRKKNNGWQVIVSFKSGGVWRQRSKQGFETKREAQEFSYVLMKEIDEDPDPSQAKTLLQVCDEMMAVRRSSWAMRTANRWRNYRETIRRCVPGKPMHELTTMDLMDVVGGERRSYVPMLRVLFHYALANEYVRRVPEFPRPMRPPRKGKAFSLELIDDVVESIDEPYATLIYFLSRTGLRISEARAVRKLDFHDGWLTVDKQWFRKEPCSRLKTQNSYREVPVPKSLQDRLERSGLWDKADDERLFSGAYKSLGEIGIPDRFPPMCYHDFRHSYGSNLILAGIDIIMVARLMGDTVSIVTSTYLHANENYKKGILGKIEEIF